ncbi:MAG: phosphopantothenoylcysteine decarboxylase [Phycisphaeraceae bacterium]|nr:phosphopantothenoylcysteine decarboxylase [Phycisphaeraceae bacterium]MCW5753234.1 phosphopantothenoylcysteine decarboxylase [Phycisphaeraceae bacterium]
MPPPPPPAGTRRLLITAGPTHEPIDAVRFIGNRSSGRLGAALADRAVVAGYDVLLLLGPSPAAPSDSRVRTLRFRTCADLQSLLAEHAPWADVVVMAAAVADYRPRVNPEDLSGKRRRTAGGMILELESTPDLLAGVATNRRSGQLLVGFALEPRDEMLASARSKLERKKIDMVVANPLETMDAPTIEATVVGLPGTVFAKGRSTPGCISKDEFAGWLLAIIEEASRAQRT